MRIENIQNFLSTNMTQNCFSIFATDNFLSLGRIKNTDCDGSWDFCLEFLTFLYHTYSLFIVPLHFALLLNRDYNNYIFQIF